MIDTLPLWLALPLGIAAWGYLALDALIAAHDRRKENR